MEQDKYIRQIAENHEIPVDFEQLWNKLEPHVPQKKTRRPVFIWFWFAGIAVVSIGLGLTLAIKENSQGVAAVQNGEAISLNTSQKILSNMTVLTNEKNEYSNPIQNITNSALGSTYIDFETKSNLETHVPKVYTEGKNATSQSKNHQPSITIGASKQISNDILDINDVQTERNNKLNSRALSVLGVKSVTNAGLFMDENQKRTCADVHNLPLIMPQISLRDNFAIGNIKVSNKRKQSLLMQVGTGIFSLQHSIKNTASAEYLKHLQAEKPLEYLSIGAFTDIKLSNRWYLQPGLRYSRYTTRLESEFVEYTSITKQDVTEIIIDESGFVSTIQGPVAGTSTAIIKSKWHTYYHSFDVPINVRYLVAKTYKHKFFMDGGAIFQVWTGSEGGFLSPNGKLQKYNLSSNPYRPNRIGYCGGLVWEWRVTRHGALSTGVSYDSRSMERFDGGSNVIKSLSSYSMNLGYRINF